MFKIVDCDADRHQTRADARRNHVLETARNLFCENGFHQTGMAQIADASGIKVGQIYRDFESKEDIIAAICENGAVQWLEEDALASAVAAQDLAAIRRWIERFGKVKKTHDDCRMRMEIVAEAGRNERVAAINTRIDRRVRNNLEAALKALFPSPEKDIDRRRVADLILALGAGVATRRIVDPELDLDALNGHLGDVLDRELEALGR